MDHLMTNSRLGLNHHIQDELNIDNNLTTNSGFGLNHHIDHQELSTYINPTANNSGFGLNHHHIKEVNTYKLTANSGFVRNHYVWEHNTNRLTVNSELDLKHYVQEDNVKAQKKKVSTRIDSSGRLLLPPTFQNPNKKTTYEFKNKKKTADKDDNGNNTTQTFTFRELASATKNFRQEYLLGAGGFGNVFKGRLQNSGQLVAIKQLDRNGLQGNREFLAEALFLGLLRHQNLVNLIGYCADGDQRLLVYEYMPLGTLEDHLLDLAPDQKPLDWYTRMKIAAGVAKGLAYLHDNANPPVIHRDLKSSNILLDEGFNPKLSDFGLAKLGPTEDKTQLLSQVAGTYGYCAPDYARTGKLSVKLDIYSFGVVLLELITGRRAIDTSRPTKEQNLVYWARPLFKDRKRFPSMADPLLQGDFPTKSLYQALAVAAMCIQDKATLRPLISDVANALSFIVLSLSSPDKISSDNNGKQDEHQKTIAEAGGFDSNSSKGNNKRSCWIWCK